VAAALPPGTRLYVKRDDVVVGTVGGSKARKLAFSLAAAVATDGTTAVLTAGNAGSNHAAATAAAAARVGLTPHVLLLTPEPSDGAAAVAAGGGLMGIHAAARSRLHLVPEAVHAHIGAALVAGARRLEAGGGGGGGGGGDGGGGGGGGSPAPRVAVIGMGGSDAVGLLGYLDAWDELLRQGVGAAGITDVVVATGSGGTAAGLAIAAACTGGRVRVHAVVVRNDAAHCRAHVAAMAAAWGLRVGAGGGGDAAGSGGGRPALAIDLDVVEGYDAGGYGPLAGGAAAETAAAVGAANGLALDPVYTRKAFVGMLAELGADRRRAAPRFGGGGGLFVQTGGRGGLQGVGGVGDRRGGGGVTVDAWSAADLGLA